MVRAALKGKRLGKDKKLELLARQQKSIEAKRSRDDKRWKRVLAKMDAEKAKKYKAGRSDDRAARRGYTRASLRKRTGRKADKIAYECTIHLSKYIKGTTFAKRAPKAIKRIRQIAGKMMKTKDNRVDATLNNYVWSRGVKGCPGRIRVLVQRKVAENPEGRSKRKQLYTVISHVPIEGSSLKGLTTKAITA